MIVARTTRAVTDPSTGDAVLDIESSAESSQPRELIDIVHGDTTHRITTATRDILHEGEIYVSTPAARGEVGAASVDDENDECTITLPVNHAYVRRYLQMLVPPLKTTVTLRRRYEPSGNIVTLWQGEITSMSVDDEGTEATFRVPPRASDAAQRRLPTIKVSRTCPYILYGAGCNVDRGASVGGLAHKVTTTAIGVNGREIRVDLLDTDRLDDWALGGELVVTSGPASGERMSVVAQDDLNPPVSSVVVLTLQLPIPGFQIGHSVEVYGGCDHTVTGDHGCRPKFDNVNNFGGYPSLPSANPFKWGR